MKNSAGFYKTMHLIENQIPCNIRNNHIGFGTRLDGQLNTSILFKPWPPGIRKNRSVGSQFITPVNEKKTNYNYKHLKYFY